MEKVVRKECELLLDTILFLLFIVALGWVAWRVKNEEPVFLSFWGKKTSTKADEEESDLFMLRKKGKGKDLISSMLGIKDIKDCMIHLPNNTYVMAIKCEPVNYHLRNGLEQEGIDVKFEQWLTTLDYEVVIHLQNRRVDFRQQYEDYKNNINLDENLNDNARDYCYMALEYMNQWLNAQPRFETIRYVLFPYKGESKVFSLKNLDKSTRALRELVRRASTGKNYLDSCGVKSQMCTTADLAEMLYHSLNRKRSNKARFADVQLQEMLAYYCTSEQDAIRIKKVMEDVRSEEKEQAEAV